MTTNKSLKRNVRSRMAKTGERYTAARRQVLAKAQAPASEAEPVHGPTDRPLKEWFRLLDEAGARDMPHPDIVKWLAAEHLVQPWWRQDITVRYEKHIGRRVLGQRGSTFSATATKTIAVPVEAARDAWLDARQRARWLPDVALTLRPNKVEIAKHFDVGGDQGRITVSFDPRGEARTQVAVEHAKLPDSASAGHWSAFWRARLVALKAMLEPSATGRG